MKAIAGIIYEAFDGTKFTTECDCANYEAKQKRIKKGFSIKNRYFEVIKDIENYCFQTFEQKYDDDGDYYVCNSKVCPFYNENRAHHCTFGKIPNFGFFE